MLQATNWIANVYKGSRHATTAEPHASGVILRRVEGKPATLRLYSANGAGLARLALVCCEAVGMRCTPERLPLAELREVHAYVGRMIKMGEVAQEGA